MAKNTLGSALFFGGTALIKERLDRSQFWNEHPTAKLACATMSGTVLELLGLIVSIPSKPTCNLKVINQALNC